MASFPGLDQAREKFVRGALLFTATATADEQVIGRARHIEELTASLPAESANNMVAVIKAELRSFSGPATEATARELVANPAYDPAARTADAKYAATSFEKLVTQLRPATVNPDADTHSVYAVVAALSNHIGEGGKSPFPGIPPLRKRWKWTLKMWRGNTLVMPGADVSVEEYAFCEQVALFLYERSQPFFRHHTDLVTAVYKALCTDDQTRGFFHSAEVRAGAFLCGRVADRLTPNAAGKIATTFTLAVATTMCFLITCEPERAPNAIPASLLIALLMLDVDDALASQPITADTIQSLVVPSFAKTFLKSHDLGVFPELACVDGGHWQLERDVAKRMRTEAIAARSSLPQPQPAHSQPAQSQPAPSQSMSTTMATIASFNPAMYAQLLAHMAASQGSAMPLSSAMDVRLPLLHSARSMSGSPAPYHPATTAQSTVSDAMVNPAHVAAANAEPAKDFCTRCNRDDHTNVTCWVLHPELRPKNRMRPTPAKFTRPTRFNKRRR